MLYANRLAVSQHAAVDGEVAIADFIAMRRSFGQRSFHRRIRQLSSSVLTLRRGSKKIHRHIAAADSKEGSNSFRTRKTSRSYLPAPASARYTPVQTCPLYWPACRVERRRGCACDRNESPQGRGVKGDAAHTVRWDKGRAFLRCSIHVRRRRIVRASAAVPACPCRCESSTTACWPSLKSQERPREPAVVGGRGNDVVARQFDRRGGDAQGVVCGSVFGEFVCGHPRRYRIACRKTPRKKLSGRYRAG